MCNIKIKYCNSVNFKYIKDKDNLANIGKIEIRNCYTYYAFLNRIHILFGPELFHN